MTASGERNETDEALARSVVYRALTLGFRNPGRAGADWRASARAALVPAARLLDGKRLRAAPLLPAVERLLEAATGGGEAAASAHARLFGHARGEVCPFETEYGAEGTHRQPHELADIAGYYLAFGLMTHARADQRADHVACECEFMDFLARKEAFLLSGGAPELSGAERAETLETVRHAARSFLRDHLGRFGRAFATRLIKEGRGAYGALGELLLRLLEVECERFGVAPGPATLDLRPPLPDDVPMACGGAGCGSEELELIQLQVRRP